MNGFMVIDEINAKVEEVKAVAEQAKTAAAEAKAAALDASAKKILKPYKAYANNINAYVFDFSNAVTINVKNITSVPRQTYVSLKDVYFNQVQHNGSGQTVTIDVFEINVSTSDTSSNFYAKLYVTLGETTETIDVGSVSWGGGIFTYLAIPKYIPLDTLKVEAEFYSIHPACERITIRCKSIGLPMFYLK